MMKLLVPITPEEERGWHAIRSAILLARRVGGHVDAVFVRGDTAAAKFFTRVDVTEEFPFLVTKMLSYYDR